MSLSANFTSNSGGSGGGTPRFVLGLDDNGTEKFLVILLGNAPNYVDSDAALNAYSGVNLIGNNDTGRYDTSHFAGGSPFTTYNTTSTSALPLVGNLKVLEIAYVTDTFGNFPSRDETLAGITGTATVTCPADSYQLSYAANLTSGDSNVNLTNTGGTGGFEPGGNICANVYVFAEDQQLVACCSCPLTPNHLKTLSVRNDLINNTLTPGIPIGVTIALLGSTTCNAATVGADSLVSGLRAWSTTIHAQPDGSYGVTENKFVNAPLSTSELGKLASYCGFIQANGSGYGICNACREGAAGANRL